jgi:hypothetical protein
MVMGMREKLIGILRVPIYPHELADPTEVVADYLLDNDVVPVVRCKDCKHWHEETGFCEEHSRFDSFGMDWNMFAEDDFCSYGERRTDERKAD